MKTTMLTLLFLLIFASAFSQTESRNLCLNPKANDESLFQNGIINSVHFDTTLGFTSHIESAISVGPRYNNFRFSRFQAKSYLNPAPHLNSIGISNRISVLSAENEYKSCKNYRINRIVNPIENTNGSKLLWLMGGMIKYSQFSVIRGVFSWDSDVYRL